MTDPTKLKVQEEMAARAKHILLAYAACFSDEDGRTVLQQMEEHAFRVRREPLEGMTMQETAMFALGEQSMFHMLRQNIENGRKV